MVGLPKYEMKPMYIKQNGKIIKVMVKEEIKNRSSRQSFLKKRVGCCSWCCKTRKESLSIDGQSIQIWEMALLYPFGSRGFAMVW